jgi:hypothetical protein
MSYSQNSELPIGSRIVAPASQPPVRDPPEANHSSPLTELIKKFPSHFRQFRFVCMSDYKDSGSSPVSRLPQELIAEALDSLDSHLPPLDPPPKLEVNLESMDFPTFFSNAMSSIHSKLTLGVGIHCRFITSL